MKRFLASLLTICLLCGMLPSFVLAEDALTLPEFPEEDLYAGEIIPEVLPEIPADPGMPAEEGFSEEPDIPAVIAVEDAVPMPEEEELLLTEEIIEQEASERQSGGFIYEVLPDGTAKITGSTWFGNVVIPAELDGYRVTCLGARLFGGRANVSGVSIPATVTYFGDDPSDNSQDYVFAYCTELHYIDVDEDNPAFCSVNGVLFSKDMTILYNYPAGKSAESYRVPAGVKELSHASFGAVQYLKTLYLDDRDTAWYADTFFDTPALTVSYPEGGRAEACVKSSISHGLVYDKDTNFCRFQPVSGVSPTPGPDDGRTDADKPLIAFVERSYSLILGRAGDQEGIEYWTKTLKSGAAAGADIVDSFCASPEFSGKGLADEEKIGILYRTMMDRTPDSDGVRYWKSILDSGWSFRYVINGFASSAEFGNICRKYGINAGSVMLENRERNPAVTAFVNRCYQVALGRDGDIEGLNGWTGNLLSKTMSAQEVSYAFLFSKEFEALRTGNEEFVTRLYRLYMDRDPDSAGKRGWVSQLNGGAARKSVAQGFANSAEFAAIVRSYGLDFVSEDIPGSGAPSPGTRVTKDSILALMDAYDPDGAFIFRNSEGSSSVGNNGERSFADWFHSSEELGQAVYHDLNTAVHESCHAFAGKAGWGADNIYVGNGNTITVPRTDVFDSIEMVSSIPSAVRTFRFNTYINTENSLTCSRQFGVYGLLDEFAAYCWGSHSDVALQDYFESNGINGSYGDILSGKPTTVGSYLEFRYYILHYMLYARDHHPDVYQGIMNNAAFKTAFSAVDAKFSEVHEQNLALFRIYSEYFTPLGEEYNAIMNELSKAEYVNMADLLRR